MIFIGPIYGLARAAVYDIYHARDGGFRHGHYDRAVQPGCNMVGDACAGS